MAAGSRIAGLAVTAPDNLGLLLTPAWSSSSSSSMLVMRGGAVDGSLLLATLSSLLGVSNWYSKSDIIVLFEFLELLLREGSCVVGGGMVMTSPPSTNCPCCVLC